tara:strand:- start:274717 stop:275121 length:405 start_codon:yes stop_codon:yes gene_type:complete
MQLKLRRSQKSGLTGTPIFILDVMAELTDEEAELVKKYKLKGQLVYTSEAADQNLAKSEAGSWAGLGGALMDRVTKRSFSLGDLVSGQHLECKDLNEVVATENQVHQACRNIRGYIDVARQFDGSEQIVEIEPA